MLGFLWDLHQQSKINELGRRAAEGGIEGREALQLVGALEARADSLTLMNMAMWSIIREKLGVTDEQLAARIEQIDLQDGTLDGRAAPTVAMCNECGRRMSARHRHCMYCGAEGLRGRASGA